MQVYVNAPSAVDQALRALTSLSVGSSAAFDSKTLRANLEVLPTVTLPLLVKHLVVLADLRRTAFMPWLAHPTGPSGATVAILVDDTNAAEPFADTNPAEEFDDTNAAEELDDLTIVLPLQTIAITVAPTAVIPFPSSSVRSPVTTVSLASATTTTTVSTYDETLCVLF